MLYDRHDCMPYDPIQGPAQGHRGPKVEKVADFKVSSAGMHVIKRLTVNYDTPRQYVNFNRTDFAIRRRSASRDLQT